MKKYDFKKYDGEARWISYWHQINEVLSLETKKVLEIGVGNQTVASYLRSLGLEVATLDIDEKLQPDVVADVLKMPLPDNSFGVVLCCEVLEHLPFSDFEKALLEIKRVCCKDVVLSLPHFAPPVKFLLKIPFLPELKLALKIPFPQYHEPGEHQWEIGKKGFPSRKIKKIIEKHFKIKKEFVPFENQYHRFFILEKIF